MNNIHLLTSLLKINADKLGISSKVIFESRTQSWLELPGANLVQNGRIFTHGAAKPSSYFQNRFLANHFLQELGMGKANGIWVEFTEADEDSLDDAKEAQLSAMLDQSKLMVTPLDRAVTVPSNDHIHHLTDLVGHFESNTSKCRDWFISPYMEGKNLEILAVHGELQVVMEDSGVFVVGNGDDTLEDLLDQYSNENLGGQAFLIGPETRQLLRSQNLYLSQVVEAGRKVKLSEAGGRSFGQGLLENHESKVREGIRTIHGQEKMPVFSLKLLIHEENATIYDLDASPDWSKFADSDDQRNAIALAILQPYR